MSDVKWIKIATGMFDNRKIKQIRKLPDGDAIIVIWLQIICLAGITNDNGLIYFSKDIPYTDEMLCIEFDRSINVIRLALATFEKFGMIEIVDNILMVSNWKKYQSTDRLEAIKEKDRERKRIEREKKKQLSIGMSMEVPWNVHGVSQEVPSLDIDIEIDKDIDIKDKEQKKKLATAQTYFSDEKLNSTFIDFINMRKTLKNGKMTDRAITMMVNKLNKYDVMIAVSMLEQSILNNWKDVYELNSYNKQLPKVNKFNDFPQRRYDMESLERQILGGR